MLYQAVASALRKVHVYAEMKTPAYRKDGISVCDLNEMGVTGLLSFVFNDSTLADQMYQGFWCSPDAGDNNGVWFHVRLAGDVCGHLHVPGTGRQAWAKNSLD